MSTRKQKILLAEDDKLIASLVKARLERAGFEVLHFTDGRSALSAALDTSISLAILDVKMPGMDGFELLGRLRKTPSFAQTPIVMLTAMGSEKDVVRGFDLGADDYIEKPFSLVELLARVHRILKVRGSDLGADDYIEKPSSLVELLARVRRILKRR